MENLESKKIESPQESKGPAPDLTITDLANIRAIIDVAVRRGAFAASEVSGVGTVFDKLNAFLNSVQPPKTDEAPKQGQ
jgi:hypothetical protein